MTVLASGRQWVALFAGFFLGALVVSMGVPVWALVSFVGVSIAGVFFFYLLAGVVG